MNVRLDAALCALLVFAIVHVRVSIQDCLNTAVRANKYKLAGRTEQFANVGQAQSRIV